ncbi:MAG TPA: AAA family ATPase [Candidatus Elarobacter sp.]
MAIVLVLWAALYVTFVALREPLATVGYVLGFAFLVFVLFYTEAADVAVSALIDKDPDQIPADLRLDFMRLRYAEISFISGRQLLAVAAIVGIAMLCGFVSQDRWAVMPSEVRWVYQGPLARLAYALYAPAVQLAFDILFPTFFALWFVQLPAKFVTHANSLMVFSWLPTRAMVRVAITIGRRFQLQGPSPFIAARLRSVSGDPLGERLAPSRESYYKTSATLRGHGLERVRIALEIGREGQISVVEDLRYRAYALGFSRVSGHDNWDAPILRDARVKVNCPVPSALEGPFFDTLETETTRGQYKMGWNLILATDLPVDEDLDIQVVYATERGAVKSEAGERDMYAYRVSRIPTAELIIEVYPARDADFILTGYDVTTDMSDDARVNQLEARRVRVTADPRGGYVFRILYPLLSTDLRFTWTIGRSVRAETPHALAQRTAQGSEWTVEYVRKRLQSLAAAPPESERSPDGYEQAASVLAQFDPAAIVPVAGAQATTKEQLIANSSVLFDKHGRARSVLSSDRRRAALESLGASGIRVALERNPRPTSELQSMFLAYVYGTASSLERQSPAQLAATLQVTEWLAGLVPGLPETADVRRLLAKESVLRPLRELAGTAFAGRRAELAMLRDYVGFLDSTSAHERAAGAARGLLGRYDKPPLLIYGPGGIGKSALIARFILDHLESDADGPALPFAYLDFDRVSLVAERPVSLLIEAVSQLSTQFPELAGPWDELKPSWYAALAHPTFESDMDSALPVQFADLLQDAGLSGRPLLLVLDTFEEVQYRSRDFVGETFAFLRLVQRLLPRLRIVCAGRAAVNLRGHNVRNEALLPLDEADAVCFLRERGVRDEQLAKSVAKKVGGSPLSLRLALEVILQEGEDEKINWLQTRDRLFVRLRDNEIQGQLYRRILTHVHDLRVAKLAHPGLVLRRVTPELILEVLAEPCGVEVHGIEDARKLFDEMRREVWLVTIAEDGSLRHQPDVRHMMLGLLLRDEPAKVKRIQELAVAYYAGQTADDVAARGELLYHMLLLNRPRRELDAVWTPELQRYVADALDDIRAPDVRAWLAARIGQAVDDDDLTAGDLEDWERYALDRVRALLRVGRPEAALKILRERDDRTYGSPLYLPQAEAQLLVRDIAGARSSIAAGLDQVFDPLTLLKLYVTDSWADMLDRERRGDDVAAEIRRLDKRFGEDPRVLRFGLNRLQVIDDAQASDLRAAISAVALTIPDARLAAYPQVGRELAARLGRDDLPLLTRLVRLFGLGTLVGTAGRNLLAALARWDTETGVLRRYSVDASVANPDALAQNLGLLAEREALPADVRAALAECFEEQARGRTDRLLYDEIETEQMNPSREPSQA